MEDLRVLMVDDELDLLETLVKRLKRRAIDATGIDSGIKALALLESEQFDVVILDVRMPGMDGIEALREIKKKWPLTEVIMLTGHGSVESGVQGMQYGAFDYIMKPANIDELIEKVHEAHQRKVLHEKKIREAGET